MALASSLLLPCAQSTHTNIHTFTHRRLGPKPRLFALHIYSLHGISHRMLDGLCGRLRDTKVPLRREAAAAMVSMFRALSADIARGEVCVCVRSVACVCELGVCELGGGGRGSNDKCLGWCAQSVQCGILQQTHPLINLQA